MQNMRFSPAGEQGIVVQLGASIDEETNRRIRCLMERLRERREIREMIPTFCSLLILFDPGRTSYARMQRMLRREAERIGDVRGGQKIVHEIPVCYGGEFGEDLSWVAQHAGLSEEEVIALHSSRDYLIYMLGFLPGFAYLGGMDGRLHCPRLETPRTKIPAGSVGIGGEQTGVYPLDSPGGWRLIGRTPVRPYDPQRNPAFLYGAGEYIRFCPVTEAEYKKIERDLAAERRETPW